MQQLLQRYITCNIAKHMYAAFLLSSLVKRLRLFEEPRSLDVSPINTSRAI